MRKLTGLIVVVLLAGLHILHAQTPTIQIPNAGNYPEWSSDSQRFVYQNSSKNFPNVTHTPDQIFMTAPYWEAFNPQTGSLVESSVWPLYPSLSNAEKNVFQTDDFIRTSPDGEILVYGSKDNKLTIANRKTQEVYETDIDYEAPNVLPIWWSEDGQGVAVNGSGLSPYEVDPIIYYIRLSDRSDLRKTQIYSVRLLQPMIVKNRIFSPVDLEYILDVHDHQVLTTMSDLTNWRKAELTTYEAQSYLVIWNSEHPEASIIIDAFDGGSLRGAAFVPNDPQRLLIILGYEYIRTAQFSTVQDGLYTYDIQTKALQFLSPLDDYYSDEPIFSPDGNWLALSSKQTYGYDFFRTSDLLAMKPLGEATAFPTFTPVPTFTPTAVPATATPA